MTRNPVLASLYNDLIDPIEQRRATGSGIGRLHDLEVLIDRTREVQASIAPPDLMALRQLGSLVRALEDDCRRLHARYVRDRARLNAIAHRAGDMKPELTSASRLAAS